MVVLVTVVAHIAPPSYRRLQLQDPRLRNEYRDHLHKQLTYHKVYDKVQALQEASENSKWTTEETLAYQIVDKLITESMIYAERHTGRRVSTRYEWSPELKQSVQEFRYWQLRYRQARNLHISTSRLETLHQQAGLTNADTAVSAVSEILQRLQQAATILRQRQRRHVDSSR